MDAWIEIRSRLKRDPKLKRFYRMLNIIQPTALGMLVDLWLYCFEQQNDGVLTHIDRRDIAAEMFWPEDRADELWAALIEVGPVTPRYPTGEPGFVDPDGRVHKWGEFRLHWSSLNMKQDEKRDKTRNRVKKHRERQDFGNAIRNGLVTLCNAPTSKTRKTSNTDQKELSLSADSPAKEEDLQAMVKRLSEDFERFWEAYPRKSGKKATQDLWSRLLPNQELVDKIIKQVKLQDKSDRWNNERPKFIPLPTTYLNGERWNDDVENFKGSANGNKKEVGSASPKPGKYAGR